MMKKALMSSSIVFMILASGVMPIWAGEVSISWYGQACFLIVTSQGTEIIIDPVAMGGYAVPENITPDIVTVSHEHGDHNAVGSVSGDPVVIRGLTSEAKAYAEIDQQIKDVKMYTVATYHDKEQGSQRGLNAVFVFEFDGIRLAHLGDLGHLLSEEQIDEIGEIDILMIPVGGVATIDSEEADQVVAQLNPKMIVFPMHYRTDVVTFMPDTAEDFVAEKEHVQRIDGNRYVLDLDQPPETLEYVVLNYK
ncbi:MBL fold metallo-hydrolase [bacterium]|nr:MBL fold metallo-hydrolase [bacterium]